MTSVTVLRENYQKINQALTDGGDEKSIDKMIKVYSESRHQIEDIYNGKSKDKPYEIRPIMIKTLADDLTYAMKHKTKDMNHFDDMKIKKTIIKLKKARNAGRLWCLFNYRNYTVYNASPRQMQSILAKYGNGIQSEIAYELDVEKKRKLKNKEYEYDI